MHYPILSTSHSLASLVICYKKVDSENQSLTTVRVALACTGTLNMMYLQAAAFGTDFAPQEVSKEENLHFHFYAFSG